jgi:hypothetical protein
MTLLTALNWVQRMVSLPVTSSIIGDAQEAQQLLYALAQEEVEELAARHEWPELRTSHTFTASVAELQATGLPADFDRMCADSFWNRTRDIRITGPVSSAYYQAQQAAAIVGSIMYPKWIRRSDGLHILPAPTSADAMGYDYIINTPVESAGSAAQENFEADTDVFLLGDDLLKRGVRWRYLAQKGLDYAEHMKSYELRVQNRINAKTGVGTICITESTADLPLPNIPEGDFSGP